MLGQVTSTALRQRALRSPQPELAGFPVTVCDGPISPGVPGTFPTIYVPHVGAGSPRSLS